MFIILKKRPIILGKCVFLQKKKIQERRKAQQTFIIIAFAVNLKIKHMSKAKPFVKWVGGKGQLIEQLDAQLPFDFGCSENITYIEPFVGGGAMLFYLLYY